MKRKPDHADIMSDTMLLILLGILFAVAVYLGVDLVIYCLRGMK